MNNSHIAPAKQETIRENLYGYRTLKLASVNTVQWIAQPLTHEHNDKVYRPYLVSNKSHEHLERLIVFVAESDQAHVHDTWQKLLKPIE